MKTTSNVCGKVKIVTFKKFLEMIPRHVAPPKAHSMCFNTLIEYPSFNDTDPEDTSIYERRVAYFLKGPQEVILKTALFYQASYDFMFKKSPFELFEDMCIKSMENFGNPTVLVRLGKRLFLPANPEDYRIYEGQNGIALACYAKVRTTIFEVMKITEIEALEAATEIVANFGSYEKS